MMALRIMAMVKNLKGMAQQGRAMGTAPSFTERLRVSPLHKRSLREEMLPKGKPMGDYLPVFVALGMISLQVALGLHVIKNHLAYNPEVRLRKSRREMVPQVEDPDFVANESADFMRKSFFRKVAHVQEFDTPLNPTPIRGNPLHREPRVESLKSVDVEPAGLNH